MSTKEMPPVRGRRRTEAERASAFSRQPHSNTELVLGQIPVHGRVDGHTWRKAVRASRHFLRTPPAIAVDAADLEAAEGAGAVELEITDTESGAIYWVPLAAFRQHCFRFDRGFGIQLGLPLERWVRRLPEERQLELFEEVTL